MAAVINLPRDERFGDIGTGLGGIVSGLLTGFAAKKKKEDQASALEEVMKLAEDDPANFSVAVAMPILGQAGFDPGESARIAQAMAQRSQNLRQREFQTVLEESRQQFQAGESELGREATAGLQGERIEATAAAAELDQAFEEQQNILKLDRKGTIAAQNRAQELQISTDKITAAADRATATAKAADVRAEADRVSREKIAGLKFKINKEQGEDIAKIPGLADAMEAGKTDRSLALITGSGLNVDSKLGLMKIILDNAQAKAKAGTAGGKESFHDVILPGGNKRTIKANVGETGQQAFDRLVAAGELPSDSRLGSRTEGGVNRESIAESTGLDLEKPEEAAIVSAILRDEDQIGKDIEEAFKTEQNIGGILTKVFGDKLAFTKATLGRSKVRDIMVAGEVDPGKVAAMAKQQGIEAFEKFEWIPDNITATGKLPLYLDYARVQLGWDNRSLRKFAMETLKLTSDQFDAYLNKVEELKLGNQ